MGASRESLNVYYRLKYCGSYKQFFKEIKRLFHPLFNNKYHRKVFILDNFITPYYKTIGCRIKEHVFKQDEEDHRYCCINCYKWFNEKEYFNYDRIQKIKKLKRKL